MNQQVHQVIVLGDTLDSHKADLTLHLWPYWERAKRIPRFGYVIDVTALHNCEQAKVQIWQPPSIKARARDQFVQVPFATVVLLVYDVTWCKSFELMKWWYMALREINKTAHVVVVGNKIRFRGWREVNQVEAENYAKSINAQYCEVPTGEADMGRDELFHLIAELPLPGCQAPQVWKDVRRVIDNAIEVVESRWAMESEYIKFQTLKRPS